MAMLCILKCDYDVRPKICRGTYVAINKLVTKSYKIIFKRMMTSVSRKWIAGRFGVGLSPQNHPLKSARNRGNKVGFYLC